MKTCFKCDRRLPLSEFYRHPMMGDGHLGKCKACARKDVRENRAKKRDYYLEYDRERSRSPERIAGITASKQRRPERERARRMVHIAVANGTLVKPTRCQECGNGGRIEGHHPDYSKPLDVMWLCRPCHALQHRFEEAA